MSASAAVAEGAGVEPFTPFSLSHLATPPVFLLRAAGKRELREYQYALAEEGLHYPPDAAIRAHILSGVGELYAPDQAEAAAARLRAFWDSIDRGAVAEPGESAAVSDLVDRLTQAYPPLARAAAARIRFLEESAAVAVAMFVVGWRGIDLPYRREIRVPLSLVDELQERLVALEQQTAGDGPADAPLPGLAFLELCNAATQRLGLTKAAEAPAAPPAEPPPPPPQPSPPRRRRPRRPASESSRRPAPAKDA